MSGKQSTNTQQEQSQNGTGYTEVTGIQPYQQQFGQSYNNLNNAYQGLQSNPYQVQNSSSFSPLVQYGLSAGIQNNNNQQNTANRALAMNLSKAGTGNNGALLSALKARGAYGTAGANNALIPQAVAQQQQYDVQQNQQNLAARQQYGAELGQQQNLMQLLNSMAGLSAGQRTKQMGTSTNQAATTGKKSFF